MGRRTYMTTHKPTLYSAPQNAARKAAASGSGGLLDAGFLANVERLLAEQEPRRRKREVRAHERRTLRQAALGGVREEAGDDLLRSEARHASGLGEAFLGQGGLVVDEVPVRAADQADVGLQDQDLTAWPEERVGHAQLLEHGLGRGQVLQVVAEEGEVEVVVGEHVGQVEAARVDEAHVLRQLVLDRADVGRPSLPRLDVADEVASIAGDVDDSRVRLDVALEESAKLPPDRVLGRPVLLVEAEVVDLLEHDRGQLVGDGEPFVGRGHVSVATTLTPASADPSRLRAWT